MTIMTRISEKLTSALQYFKTSSISIFTKVKPHVTKKRVIRASILVFLILLIFFIYLFSSARLHFYTQGDVVIYYDKSPYFKTILRNETTLVTINTEVDSFAGCQVQCSFQSNDYLYTTNFNSHSEVSHNISVQVPEWGMGKTLTQFQTTCHSIPSFTCAGSSNITKTATIITQYILTEQDESVLAQKDEYEAQINEYYYIKNNSVFTGLEYFDSRLTYIYDSLEYYNPSQIIAFWNNEQFALIPEPKNTSILTNAFEQTKVEVFEYLEQENLFFDKYNDFILNENVSFVLNYSQLFEQPNVSDYISQLYFITDINGTDIIPNIQEKILIINETFLFFLSEYDTLILTRELINETVQLYLNETNQTTDLCQDYLQVLDENNISYLYIEYCTAQSSNNTLPQLQTVNHTYVFSNTSSESIYLADYPICNKDCIEQNSTVVLFVHGHAFTQNAPPEVSISSLSNMQRSISIPSGSTFRLDTSLNLASNSLPNNISFLSTYYQIIYHELGDYIYSTQKSSNIENYALRLRETIQEVRRTTGVKNVTLIAHSMGGLVVREYLRIFDDEHVAVITINTPHHGIVDKTAQFCSIFGSSNECEDMMKDSVFLKRLDNTEIVVPFYNIYSSGCIDNGVNTDGVITVESAKFDKSTKQFQLNGTCQTFEYLHNTVIDPKKNKEIIPLIESILTEI